MDSDEDGFQDGGDIKKPRKLDDDMVEYMKQLEIPLTNETKKRQQQVAATSAGGAEEKQGSSHQTAYDDEHMDVSVLARNLLQQLKNKEASAATHRRCSVVLEKLLRLAKPELVAGFLTRIQNYTQFSATNRYASHVLQTALHKLGEYFAEEITSPTQNQGEEDQEDLKLERELNADPEQAIISFAKSMKPHFVDYLFGLCSTHVVRALMSVLVGATVPTGSLVASNTTFSKQKRKRKSGNYHRHESHQIKGRDNFSIGPGGTNVPHKETTAPNANMPKKRHSIPGSFLKELSDILKEIVCLPGPTLYDACFDVNASPCLQHILKVLSLLTPEEVSHLPFKTDDFGSVLLQLENGRELIDGEKEEDEDADDGNDENPVDTVIKMCYSDTASHVVETVVQASGDNFYQQLLDDVLLSHIQDLAKSKSSSYVIQQLLLCTRQADQVEKLVSELVPLLPELAKTGNDQSIIGLVDSVARLVHIPASGSTVNCLNREAAEKLQRTVTKKLHSVALDRQTLLKSKCSSDMEELVVGNPMAWWLDIGHQRTLHQQHSGDVEQATDLKTIKEESDLGISPDGCKLVYSMICLLPSASKSTLRAITSLPSSVVVALAKHPWGSRYVLEPIFSGPDDFHWAKNKLVGLLENDWINLSCDRFGCHVVQKAFLSLNDVERKADMARQLLKQERKVQGSHFGRFVVRTIKLDHFKQDETSWKSSIKKESERVALFDDIIHAPVKSAQANAADDGSRKKKRKKEKKQ